jgi:hypothetical protein
MPALVLEHLGHADLLALGMAELDPQLPAALADTGVEFVNAAEAHLPRRLGSSLLPGTPWTRTCINLRQQAFALCTEVPLTADAQLAGTPGVVLAREVARDA